MTTPHHHHNHRPRPPADTPPDNVADLRARLSTVHRPDMAAELVDPLTGQLVALDPATGRLARRQNMDVIDLTPPRRRRFPLLFSALLIIASHAVLAATVAHQNVPALIGASAAGALAVCGLALIAAELASIATRNHTQETRP